MENWGRPIGGTDFLFDPTADGCSVPQSGRGGEPIKLLKTQETEHGHLPYRFDAPLIPPGPTIRETGSARRIGGVQPGGSAIWVSQSWAV